MNKEIMSSVEWIGNQNPEMDSSSSSSPSLVLSTSTSTTSTTPITSLQEPSKVFLPPSSSISLTPSNTSVSNSTSFPNVSSFSSSSPMPLGMNTPSTTHTNTNPSGGGGGGTTGGTTRGSGGKKALLSKEQTKKLVRLFQILKSKNCPEHHPTFQKCILVLREQTLYFSQPELYGEDVAHIVTPTSTTPSPSPLKDSSMNSSMGQHVHAVVPSSHTYSQSILPLSSQPIYSNMTLHGEAGESTLQSTQEDHRPNEDYQEVSNHQGSMSPTMLPVRPKENLFTGDQLKMLHSQIMAYRYLSRNMKIPESLYAILMEKEKKVGEDTSASGGGMAYSQNDRIKEAKMKKNDSIRRMDPYGFIQSQAEAKRLIVPSRMPSGIDPYQLMHEKKKNFKSRVQYRIHELENLPSHLPNNVKIKALIELKALRLLEKQQMLRKEILSTTVRNAVLETSVDRASYRRLKKQSLKEARITERLERQHRLEKEKKERQKHQEYLASILQHARDLKEHHRNILAKSAKLSRAVLQYHSNLEREEQKRVERVEKERIRALKADDEEAYLKLIDQKKDTRLTHLLRQTDQYLETLSQMVLEQKKDGMNAEELLEVEEGRKEYYQIAHSIQEHISEQPSILVGGKLKEYQVRGLQWLISLYNNNLNGILADEMGLGKTIQTIALITYLIEHKKNNGPFLVIVPLSTMTNWVLEFEKWAPSIAKIIYKGTPGIRKQIFMSQTKNAKFNVLITTYDYVIRDRSMLAKIKWVYLIVDEGHRMKNAHCKLTLVLGQYYHCRHRLLLTGTPLQNSIPELWALLNFILPKIFNSCKNFEEWFNAPFANTGEQIELNEEEKLLIIRRLHKVLRPFLLRRLKKDVESELPDKVERVIKCQLSALQKRLCNEVKKVGISSTTEGPNKQKRILTKGLNNTIMLLRKVCNHPFVFEEVERQVNPNKITDDLIFRVSGKFELLDRILPKLLVTGHKALMFFQMTQVMTIMEDYCSYRGFNYLRLDGATKAEDRSDLLQRFNAPDSNYFLFLLSTRAGGLGLNLQSSDTVVIFDSDWNPHQDLQAQDRAHRIGQTKEVRILRLICIDSVEEHILARAQYKLNVDEKVIQAGRFDQKSTAEEREAVLRSLFEQDEQNSEVDDEVFDDDELNEVLARSDKELEIFREMDINRMKNEREKWTKSGKKGPVPPRLIELKELPPIYLEDVKEDLNEDESLQSLDDDSFAGRKRRAKTEITYDDGLTEDQWLRSIENGKDVQQSMHKKRKRRQQQQDRLNFLDQESESDTASVEAPQMKVRVKKRGEKTDGTLTTSVSDLKGIFNHLYQCVVNAEDEDGRLRADIFLSLPSKKEYPDYYQQIKRPISLEQINDNILIGKYDNLKSFMVDMELMFSNARLYNVEDSLVYADAVELEKLLHIKADKIGSQPTIIDNTASFEKKDRIDTSPIASLPKDRKISIKFSLSSHKSNETKEKKRQSDSETEAVEHSSPEEE